MKALFWYKCPKIPSSYLIDWIKRPILLRNLLNDSNFPIIELLKETLEGFIHVNDRIYW